MQAIIPLAPFASPQPHSLTILLKLGDQGIPVLHHICVLLILRIGSVRLDNPVYTVDCACDTVAGDELGEIPIDHSVRFCHDDGSNE